MISLKTPHNISDLNVYVLVGDDGVFPILSHYRIITFFLQDLLFYIGLNFKLYINVEAYKQLEVRPLTFSFYSIMLTRVCYHHLLLICHEILFKMWRRMKLTIAVLCIHNHPHCFLIIKSI